MKRTKEEIQREITRIKGNNAADISRLNGITNDTVAKLEAEIAALPKPFTAEDIVPGAAFKDGTSFTVFVVHDRSPNMYRLGGNTNAHPCSLFSDAARSRAGMAEYLSKNFPDKVPGEVKFLPKKSETKAGDTLDCVGCLPEGTRFVRVYPDGTVKLFDENGVSCNTFGSLAQLNAEIDGNFSMYARRA